MGAITQELPIWCYLDPNTDHELCPDSKRVDSELGYYYSRLACITETATVSYNSACEPHSNDYWQIVSENATKNCQCISPAMYTEDGRGNCNVGALKPDLRVWCYLDANTGPALCPDSIKSATKGGLLWSRLACITD